MNPKILLTLLFLSLTFQVGKSQEIFKNYIKNHQIILSKNNLAQFVLTVTKQKKIILEKTFPIVKLHFYNLDSNSEDEMILIRGEEINKDTLYTLYVYTFEKNFKLCDSIYLDKYLPEFYQFDLESNYFIKVYDFGIEKIFPSNRVELPFTFFYIDDCKFELDNEFSFEEYEAEINYLVDEISELKNKSDCSDWNQINEIKRLIACLYVNIQNAAMGFDIKNFIEKNYPCRDKSEFINRLEKLFNGPN